VCAAALELVPLAPKDWELGPVFQTLNAERCLRLAVIWKKVRSGAMIKRQSDRDLFVPKLNVGDKHVSVPPPW